MTAPWPAPTSQSRPWWQNNATSVRWWVIALLIAAMSALGYYLQPLIEGWLS